MATLFLEGFDKYGPVNEYNPDVAELMTQGAWNNHGGTPVSIVPGLSHTGYAMYAQGTVSWVAKTLPFSNRLIGGLRFNILPASGTSFAPLIGFRDIGTQQCAIRVNGDGSFTLLRADYFFSNVDLDTSDASISFGVTHYLEFDITFGNAAPYIIYLDGAVIMNGTADTTVTANNSANGIVIGNNSGLNSVFGVTFDDLYIFDTAGGSNNSVLLTSPRIETRYPESDIRTDFSNIATILGTKNSVYSNAADAPGANSLFLQKYTSVLDQTINSVSCIPRAAHATAKFTAVLYSDAAGSPGALLSSGLEVSGTSTNVILTSALSTPTILAAGSDYWVGFITDTDLAMQLSDNLNLGRLAANTYTSGAPGTAPSTVNQPSWTLWGNCVGAAVNWTAVSVNPAPDNYARISSTVVGDQDVYGFPHLHADEATIYCIAVKGSFKRSDTGPRTVDLRLISGGVDSAGSKPGLTSGTSYGWADTHFEKNPDGNVAWTLAAANAIAAGPKIAS